MDTPQVKKDDFMVGDIQINTMPNSVYGNTPKSSIPTAPPKAMPQTASLPNTPSIGNLASPQQVVPEQKSNQYALGSKKSNKKTIGFVLLGLLVLILGAGAYWYFAYGQTMLLTRQLVLKLDIPYQNYVSNFDFVMDIKTKKNSDLGAMNSDPLTMFLPDADNFKVSMKGLNHTVGKDYDGNVQINVSAGFFAFDNSVDFKQVGKDIYFKFSKEFLSELLGELGLDFSEFFNPDRWLTFNWDDIQKFADSEYGLTMNTDSFNLEKQLEQRKKMDEYFKQFKLHEIFQIEDTKENKESKDGQLKKFQLIAKPSKINDLIAMFSILNLTYLENSELKNTQEIKEKILKDLADDRSENADKYTKIENIIQNTDFFIWINTKTKSFQGASLVWDGDSIDLGDEKIVLTGHYDFLNELEDGYVISRPEQTITVMQAYENTMNKIEAQRLETMKQYEEQNNKDSDGDGLSDVMESFYGTSALKPDSDGDGFTDGEEVDNGYNPLGPGKIDLGQIRS